MGNPLDIVKSGIGMVTGDSEAKAQAKASKAMQKRKEAIAKRGLQVQQETEPELMKTYETPTAGIEELQSMIEEGTAPQIQEATKDISAEMIKQGVVGPRAANLAARQIGEMRTEAQKDLARLNLDDEARRAAEKRAYLASKAGTGTSAYLGQTQA